MFTKKKSQPSQIEAEIERTLTKLKNLEPKSEEYVKIVDQIVKLHKMKEEEKPSRVSPDTLALIAANLLGILWVARYERENVITARTAMGMIRNPR